MKKTVLLVGAFDTKGEEFAYVRDLIVERGHHVMTMDTGVLGEPVGLIPDVSAAEVAQAADENLERLRVKGDRGVAINTMITGVQQLVLTLYTEGRFDGVLSLGGGAGTSIATAAMRQLPVGVPKVMVSTLASSDVRSYVGVKDITMMYSVTDIAGLNRLSRQIFSNAVGAICGMLEQPLPEVDNKPLIAATMFGVTTPCLTRVRQNLEKAGYELLIFHATGTGGRAMEMLIEDGFFAGVTDITTTEWADQVVGGVLGAGEDRMGSAAKKGIPQVVSCGALDMVNFHAIESVPKRFKDRNLYKHNPTVTLMRTSAEECWAVGKKIAEKLNQAKGSVTLMLPLGGLSSLDALGKSFYGPEANRELFESLKKHIESHVHVVDLDLHINDEAFADAVSSELLALLS